MATFHISTLKFGNERDPSFVKVLVGIDFNEQEDSGTVVLPETHEGEPVTYIAYEQAHRAGYQDWADWHHCKEGDYIPGEYYMRPLSFYVPAYVKRLVIPATVQHVSPNAFRPAGDTVIEDLREK